jgi:hypothetical protein
MNKNGRIIFVLSPANLSGRRANTLLSPRSTSALAEQLRLNGAPLGEIFSFVSGLYFRGKLAYATAFSESTNAAGDSIFVITTTRGLLSPHSLTHSHHLREMAEVPIDIDNDRYRVPLERDLELLSSRLAEHDRVILLGSIATPKYIEPMRNILGQRFMIPAEFVGRGDMSRGSLMLRAVRDGIPLKYVQPAICAEKCPRRKLAPPFAVASKL